MNATLAMVSVIYLATQKVYYVEEVVSQRIYEKQNVVYVIKAAGLVNNTKIRNQT